MVTIDFMLANGKQTLIVPLQSHWSITLNKWQALP